MARLDSPQDVVEDGMAAPPTDGTVVIVTQPTEGNQSWANI